MKSFILISLIGFYCNPLTACTIFKMVVEDRVLMGNNEDFNDKNTFLWAHPASEDQMPCVFFGYADKFPQGGVNAMGLAYDWVAHESVPWSEGKASCPLKGYLCQEILERCSTVREVLNYYQSCDEWSFQNAHIMWVDAKGHSAIIGFDNGELNIQYDSSDFQIYGFGERIVQDQESNASLVRCQDLLEACIQGEPNPTQYSIIYDLSHLQAQVFVDQQFDSPVILDFDTMVKLGYKKPVSLRKLRKKSILFK